MGKSIQKIQEILDTSSGTINNTGDIFINILKNEFILLNGKIAIPNIPVKELDYEKAQNIIEEIIRYIPEFLSKHTILAERNPPSEQHSLHFIRKFPGKLIEMVHIYKIDLRFGGGAADIIDKGDSNRYPSYYTDRIYYKSRIVPELKNEKTGQNTTFIPLRVFKSSIVEGDQYFHTFAMFDDADGQQILGDLHSRINLKELLPVSIQLYPFIVYDYFSFCLNVFFPKEDELRKACKIFEPLFLYIFSLYNEIEDLFSVETISSTFSGLLRPENKSITLTESFIQDLSSYFTRFSLYRDDDLALKGWWRMDLKD